MPFKYSPVEASKVSINTPFLNTITAIMDILGFFGRTDFSRISIFGPTFFLGGICRRIFSPLFCHRKVPRKSSSNIPNKILQNLYNKIPETALQRGRANISGSS